MSDAPDDFNVPMDTTTSSRGQVLARWVLRLLMVMQASFKLPDTAIQYFLRFFGAIFTIIGNTSEIARDICTNLPRSMYKARKAIGEVIFQRFVVCRKCLSLYTFSESIESSGTIKKSKHCSFCRFPSHPHTSMRLPCGTLLLKSVELASKRTYLYPFLTYCYLGLEVSLQSMFDTPNFYLECERWRSRTVCSGVMEDVYDGEMWQRFQTYNGESFLSEAGNLGLILNFDFFQPFEHLSYSLGALYMCVLNLPREVRYKQHNVILVGLVPGPHEPKRDINTFLKPLVDDLLKLWSGVQFNVHSVRSYKIIRCALLCVACGLPAGRKVCGFLGHGARLGCSRCYKEFPGSAGTMDYSGFDRNSWRKRTKDEHVSDAFRIKNMDTLSAMEKAESDAGCRYSELMLLPYFDGPKMLVIDPMHNLFLGTAKRFLKEILIANGIITSANMDVIQQRVNSFTCPAGIGRIPLKIQSGFSQFTADQWKNWVIYFSIGALRNIVTGEILECWRHYVLACRVLCVQKITLEKAKLGDALLMQFCRRTERLFGKHTITPNMHLHSHLLECIVDYGPLHNFWCFAFERYNGILGAMPNNNRSIESQLMKRFLNENCVLTHSFVGEEDELTSQLLPLLPKKEDTGSYGETVSSVQTGPVANSTGWSINSIRFKLPKYCSRWLLNSFQKIHVLKMYAELYSVSESDVEVTETCFSYTSVVLNGRMYGCAKSRTASSSMVVAKYSSQERAARVEKIFKHTVTIAGEVITHLFAYVSWFESYPQPSIGKPVSVWYNNDTHIGFIPVQSIVCRTVTLVDDLDGQSVLFVVPCIEH